ncbi:MAG: isoleucine--tRNA ligase [Bacillota bacterium]|nr:isoleucine--tRNA ligase [Bacillota bacterium]
MYEKVNADMNFVAREQEIEKFWRERQIFEKSLAHRAGCPTYMFYDGPPTANGKPHIGHVLTRAIKDIIPRYKTMKGYNVPRKAGWDTHGLPVELEVERKLGINGKEQIEQYGLAPFIEECKKSVWEYKQMWEDFSFSVGFWADMDDPYVTYHNSYIESVWWSLKKIWDRQLLYKGFKIVPYCPRCGTPLSSHEVALGYKDVKERSATVRFKVKGEDAYILAWTTTPWTLPSNVSLCVNPKERYIKLRANSDGLIYYLAEYLAAALFPDGYEVLGSYIGKELEYKEYEPLWDFVSPKEKAWYVTCDDYVTLTDGTGVVHTAPAFGEDDANVGRKYGLPLVQLVDAQGCMTAETLWPGVFCKDADLPILQDLEARGLLFDAPNFEHSYPFCWRCDTPLIYYARESWFIKMTEVREDLLRNNKTINWMPPSIGEKRFGDWLENIQDWAISRDRYWGTPLPIWQCANGHMHCIGSIEELKSMSDNCPADIELHRPYIDAVTVKCPVCGEEMRRVPEVIDCWYDSGAMPFAQHHYPFENKELFEQQYPADYISEAVDQTRGWFYSLLAISTLIFNDSCYKNVIVLGHVQDENGQKMSKSKGNAVEPMEALRQYGADAIRWYFYTNSAPWLPNRFNGKTVIEGQRKFMSTLWNTYAFFVLYANIDEFDASRYTLGDAKLTIMDKWLLSRLNTLIGEVDGHFDNYRIPEAGRAISDFVDELSNWYVRRCRERFWVPEMTEDKLAAYITLHHALVTLSKLSAPMIPFMAESVYRNLACSVDAAAPESVHLCDFPIADASAIDKQLEDDMELALQAVTLGRAARNAGKCKNRQPLAQMLIKAEHQPPQMFLDIIAEELNVKDIAFIDDADKYISFVVKPQLKVVGQKYGAKLNQLREALAALDGNAARAQLIEQGFVTAGEFRLTEEELLIETAAVEGYVAFADSGMTVVLDTTLTPQLIEEGVVREIINKLQTMRKDAGFEVTDHILVYQQGNDKLRAIIERNRPLIAQVTLAEDILFDDMQGHSAEWDINGDKAVFGVKKLV